MTDSHDTSVDPELLPLIEAFPPLDLSAETLPGFRAAITELSVAPDPETYRDIAIDEVRVPNAGPSKAEIRCLLFRPEHGESRGALVHIHGGGFVMGQPEMDIARNIELVRATGCTILSVDYRLAPEHPHPAGLEDCHSAAVWLADQSKALRFPAERLGVIGESAGGGLAASLALMARDKGSVRFACQVLIYPMLVPPEHSVDTAEPDERTGRYIWSRASNAFGWSALLPAGAASSKTIAGIATDLSGLPPAFLAVGELDLFVHDNLDFAAKLLRAGNSAEAHLYPAAVHGFDRMADAAVSQRYTRDLIDFLKRYVG